MATDKIHDRKRPGLYPGDLGKPMKPLHIGGFFGANEDDLREWLRELDRRLLLLFRHFGIDPQPAKLAYDPQNPWQSLVIHLLAAHVPGFQVKDETRGRSKRWELPTLQALYLAVRETMVARKISEEKACEVLVKQKPWRDFDGAKRGERITASTLERRFDDAKSFMELPAGPLWGALDGGFLSHSPSSPERRKKMRKKNHVDTAP